MVAVTGQSGAGKTTLIKLLSGFAVPDAGELVLETKDGEMPISGATRQYFSYVPQGNTLFQGTIRENLQMADREADDSVLWVALETACAKDFVENLPLGLDTPIGERASGISEGQAQRIAIARAMLKKAPVVIFDEAASALDEETEAKMYTLIGERLPVTTIVSIGHRSTLNKYHQLALELDKNNKSVTLKTLE